MKQLLTTNWNGARIFRVGIGLAAIIYAISKHDNTMGWAGALILIMGLTNTGCCGASGCSTNNISSKKNKSTQEVSFEEVK
ncbi:MAG: hypothetical protein ACK5AO_00610 [bacterium]